MTVITVEEEKEPVRKRDEPKFEDHDEMAEPNISFGPDHDTLENV